MKQNDTETASTIVRYELPRFWLSYDLGTIYQYLVSASATVHSLTTTPYQRSWVEKLQAVQLKMEAAGTSRIEGADFTENELEAAVDLNVSIEDLITRSQRQARAAAKTYTWIAELPSDHPITEDLVREIHARVVQDCDDDHCEPGALRKADYNVLFGVPRHRGCEGGAPCERAFGSLIQAVREEFSRHDPLVQALAFHYHLAAMHPFMDGNGRTARAVEALMLQRAGLRDTAFVAMSNYYYDEKSSYLSVLSDVRAKGHDMTPFLVFGLKGISSQCQRLFREIRRHMQKALFRNTMFDLFGRLESTRKRVLQQRQIAILKIMLDDEELTVGDLRSKTRNEYRDLKLPVNALIRDLSGLLNLKAITLRPPENNDVMVVINLDWPTTITETEFFDVVKNMPKAKTHRLLP